MIINHNMASLNTYRQMSTNEANTQNSLAKLSSGLRINKAGDDAAGLAISEKMRGQIRGLDQGARNAQDGISMIQTAEGGLNEVHSILQRMRELAVQASNDTLQAADRSSIGDEMLALTTEIDRISTTTQFNGKNLLNGSLAGTLDATSKLQIGNSLATATGVSVSNVDVSGAAAGTTYNVTSTAGGTLTLTNATTNIAQTINIAAMTSAGKQTLNFDQLGVKFELVSSGNAAATAANLVTDLTTAATNGVIITAAGASAATFAIGANAGQNMSVAFNKIDSTTIGTVGNKIGTLITDNTNVDTTTKAQTLITSITQAIVDVSTQRGVFGAAQNRLEHTINNLNTSSENLTAAESRIRDVDMAKEMMNFQKNNILQQAAQAMLAQANQQPQGVLQLLR